MKIHVALLACFFATTAQAEVRGEVYEVLNPDAPRAEWQRVRVPNAYVVVVWRPTIPTGHNTPCIHAEIARTDEKGAYVMAGPNPLALAGIRTMVSHAAYAPGLEIAREPYREPTPNEKDISLAKFARPASERIFQLSMLADAGCRTRPITYVFDDPQGLRREYFLALLAEARALQGVADASKGFLVNKLEELAGIPKPPLQVSPSRSPRQATQVPQQ